ncbi:MAG: hypothetical protein NZ932_03855 [Candidatus Bathyarchaeota archaeon]|nr:hypothetical protein [Candidatus Bathyarchaeota archaeon]MDW8022397.1 hypothetical protein [Nitrososphaerota archaeon]
MTHKRCVSKKYEQYYGEPYKPKTLTEVKFCVKCGRELPSNSRTRNCPYCAGTIKTRYIRVR